jgi:hypothetical protein
MRRWGWEKKGEGERECDTLNVRQEKQKFIFMFNLLAEPALSTMT